MLIKFHDDPVVNNSEIVIFLRKVWWATEKKKDFGEEERETEIEGKRRHR